MRCFELLGSELPESISWQRFVQRDFQQVLPLAVRQSVVCRLDYHIVYLRVKVSFASNRVYPFAPQFSATIIIFCGRPTTAHIARCDLAAGTPGGNRTRISAVKGRQLNHLSTGANKTRRFQLETLLRQAGRESAIPTITTCARKPIR